MQQRNLLVFFVLSALMFVTYYQLRIRNLPVADADPEVKKTEAKKKDQEKEPRVAELPPPPPATPEGKLLTLGGGADSDFNLEVVLDPLGGGVRAVTLNKFRAADADGRPAGPGETLKLVPAEANEREPSNLLLHFSPKDDAYDTRPGESAGRPLDTLGRRVWQVVGPVVSEDVDGRKRQRASFRAEVEGVVVTKTYTLVEGEYHVGLQVDLERAKGAGQEPVKFRYQLTGSKGLPVEGKWYTSTFRNALIALEDKDGYIYREFEDLRQVGLWGGGNPVMKDESKFLRYAGVAVQYFASVIVVDDQQDNQKFLRRATSSLETAVARGKLKGKVSGDAAAVTLQSDDGKQSTTVYLPPHLRGELAEAREGQQIAVIYQTLSFDEALKDCPKVAVAVRSGVQAQATHSLWEDDITVRVATEPVTLKPGDKVSHKYLLYNGPVKPSLLRGLRNDKERAVAPEVIDRYVDTLKLNTMTDYHSPGVMGKFFNSIFWTPLVIKCTNFMHWVLGFVSWLVPSYGLSIILLTVMVRGLMFPLSRKQAMMSIKMQALQPEMKKLAERYHDDPQAKAQAQMELFRRHGVNPVGSCWVVLLQMPIFMGLYFALQESIQFRLASFWPTWIVNLAAPDMLLGWGRGLWFISRDADYGGMFYLGPYLNLLPLFAVGLMVVQQQMLMPPPADKEQEMQQKMMRYMMIVMGIFFYKIAAGLCIYIITSTLWGFAERKLLPKAKPVGIDADLDGRLSEMLKPSSPNGGPTAVAKPEGKKPGRNKRKGSERVKAKDEPKGVLQRFNDWWQDVLEQAKKK